MRQSLATLVLSLILAGCQSSSGSRPPAAAAPPAQPQTALEQATLQAEQAAAAMTAAQASPQVRWIAPERPALPATPAATTPTPAPPASASPPVAAATPSPSPQAAPASLAPAPLTRDDLLAQLRRSIAADTRPFADKAPQVMALTLLDPGGSNENDLLASLTPQQQRHFTQSRQLLAQLAHRAGNLDRPLDADAAAFEALQVFGQQPLRISKAALCTRVKGFGVYDEMPDATLIAGRPNPMVLYLELQNFRSIPNDASPRSFTVRLTQEVTLYNHSDGLAVWRETPVKIIDESRNQRRDFFVVQLVKLPANLSVGKYLLKTSVTDEQGGSVDELSLPIEIVSDRSVVEARNRE